MTIDVSSGALFLMAAGLAAGAAGWFIRETLARLKDLEAQVQALDKRTAVLADRAERPHA